MQTVKPSVQLLLPHADAHFLITVKWLPLNWNIFTEQEKKRTSAESNTLKLVFRKIHFPFPKFMAAAANPSPTCRPFPAQNSCPQEWDQAEEPRHIFKVTLSAQKEDSQLCKTLSAFVTGLVSGAWTPKEGYLGCSHSTFKTRLRTVPHASIANLLSDQEFHFAVGQHWRWSRALDSKPLWHTHQQTSCSQYGLLLYRLNDY